MCTYYKTERERERERQRERERELEDKDIYYQHNMTSYKELV